jgi:hypothetical protein
VGTSPDTSSPDKEILVIFLPQSLTFTSRQIWMLGKGNINILADIKLLSKQNKLNI